MRTAQRSARQLERNGRRLSAKRRWIMLRRSFESMAGRGAASNRSFWHSARSGTLPDRPPGWRSLPATRGSARACVVIAAHPHPTGRPTTSVYIRRCRHRYIHRYIIDSSVTTSHRYIHRYIHRYTPARAPALHRRPAAIDDDGGHAASPALQTRTIRRHTRL